MLNYLIFYEKFISTSFLNIDKIYTIRSWENIVEGMISTCSRIFSSGFLTVNKPTHTTRARTLIHRLSGYCFQLRAMADSATPFKKVQIQRDDTVSIMDLIDERISRFIHFFFNKSGVSDWFNDEKPGN